MFANQKKENKKMKKIKRVSAFVFAMLFTVSNSYSKMIFGAEHEKETESISDVQYEAR